MNTMDEFTVYKDVVLFLWKVFFRLLHTYRSDRSDSNDTMANITSNDEEILQILTSLLEENNDLEEDEHIVPSKRPANLKIRSNKMPPIHKNKWLSTFLDLVRADLGKIGWTQKDIDNLI